MQKGQRVLVTMVMVWKCRKVSVVVTMVMVWKCRKVRECWIPW